MADNLIPQGATVGGNNTLNQGNDSNEPLPQGATIGGHTNTTDNQPPQGILDKIGNTAHDLEMGIGKGGLETLTGTSSIINKGLNFVHQGLGDKVVPPAGLNALEDATSKPLENTTQKIGYGGETLLEFILGDEALKGLSMADKLTKSAKIAKILEGSPRIMKAIQSGADLWKGVKEFTPEELNAVKNLSPTLRKLVGIGYHALQEGARQGTVAAGQTAVKTGGDIKQAAKEGATMGGVSAAISAPLSVASKVLGSVVKGGNKIGELTEEGKKAATDSELVSGIQNKVEDAKSNLLTEQGQHADELEQQLSDQANNSFDKKDLVNAMKTRINQAENQMHTKYESGINDIQDRLQGHDLEVKGSPVSMKADELLNNPPVEVPGEHEVVSMTRGAIGDQLNPRVKSILDLVAKGEKPAEEGAERAGAGGTNFGDINPTETGPENPMQPLEPWNIDNLVQLRQNIRKMASGFDYSDINSRTLRQLLPSIDDTIQELANKAGDKSVGADYEALRNGYKNTIKYFNDPEYKIIQKLQEGSMDDAAREFLKGGKTLDNAYKLEGFLKQTFGTAHGGQMMDAFTDHVFSTMMKDAVNPATGTIDAAKLIKSMDKINPETRANFFTNLTDGGKNARIQEAMDDAKTVAGTKEALASQNKNLTRVIGNITAPTNFIEGADAMKRINTLRGLIGDEAMSEFSNNVFNTFLRDSIDEGTGQFNASKLLQRWNKINPEVRENFFKIDEKTANARIHELLSDAKAASNAQHLARAGVVSLTGATVGGLSHLGAGIGTLLGLLLGESGAGGIQKGRELLDFIANRPATWAALRGVQKVAQSKAANVATTATKVGVTKGLTDNSNNSKRRIFNGAAGVLGQ